jgi:flavin reductase (DIM6/NTAB) family NADH-FMN oxidoreductase RutF
MNKFSIIVFATFLLTAACSNRSQTNGTDSSAQKPVPANPQTAPFDELFTPIAPTDIADNVFKLVGEDYTVITAGKDAHFNSMTASWGGVGILFNRPVAWGMLRANRYTLEIIRQEKTYTLSYFPDRYKEQVLFFGSKSGRDTDKMKETTLTSIQTPTGNVAYREARLILQCELLEITTVSPDDYYTPEAKTFVMEGYNDAKEYHKLLFGVITQVWVRNE